MPEFKKLNTILTETAFASILLCYTSKAYRNNA